MSDVQAQTITIDGTEYNLEDLTDKAKAQLISIRAAEQEISRLQQQLALINTARNTYVAVLKAELPGATGEAPAE